MMSTVDRNQFAQAYSPSHSMTRKASIGEMETNKFKT
jgi:hypothetical protein